VLGSTKDDALCWHPAGTRLTVTFSFYAVHLVAISDPLTQHRRLVAKVGLPRWA